MQNIVGKEKMLVAKIFSFSHNVFRRPLSQGLEKPLDCLLDGETMQDITSFLTHRNDCT